VRRAVYYAWVDFRTFFGRCSAFANCFNRAEHVLMIEDGKKREVFRACPECRSIYFEQAFPVYNATLDNRLRLVELAEL